MTSTNNFASKSLSMDVTGQAKLSNHNGDERSKGELAVEPPNQVKESINGKPSQLEGNKTTGKSQNFSYKLSGKVNA